MSTPNEPRPRPARRARYRYLLVHVVPRPGRDAPDRADLIREVQARLPPQSAPWLTRYDGEYAVVRVLRGAEREARDRLLAGAPGARVERLEPVLTSGTLAGLERKHPAGARLRERRG